MAAVPGTAADRQRAGPDNSLERARATIEAVFRRGDADRLRPLLPQRGRLFISLPTLEVSGRYLSGNQAYLVLQGVFRRYKIRSCVLAAPKSSAGSSKQKLSGRLSVNLSPDQSAERPFDVVVVQEDGVWTIREIRERPRGR